LRAYRIPEQGPAVGMTVGQAEASTPVGTRLFVERIRRGGMVQEAKLDDVLQAGDVVAIAGRHEQLVEVLGPRGAEVDDPNLTTARVLPCLPALGRHDMLPAGNIPPRKDGG
jgi:putative transport protein